MLKLLIAADEEMRALVRQEVGGALVAIGNSETTKQINEGVRRALGAVESRILTVVREQVSTVIHARNESLPAMISRLVKEEVSAAVQAEVGKELRARIAAELDKVDVKAIVDKATRNVRLTVS
jgi:hypothetical protein